MLSDRIVHGNANHQYCRHGHLARDVERQTQTYVATTPRSVTGLRPVPPFITVA
jgi:hypothetical protein